MPLRRTLLWAPAAAVAAAALACSAPDARGLFEPADGPNRGGSVASANCVERCQNAAVRCTLVDLPCDAICASGPSDRQLACLESSNCELADGRSLAQRCLQRAGDPGVFGATCDCVGNQSCKSAACFGDLLCFDPGGQNAIDSSARPLFPGFCTKPCDPAPGGRACPAGFVCRRQQFNGEDVAGAEKHWCER